MVTASPQLSDLMDKEQSGSITRCKRCDGRLDASMDASQTTRFVLNKGQALPRIAIANTQALPRLAIANTQVRGLTRCGRRPEIVRRSSRHALSQKQNTVASQDFSGECATTDHAGDMVAIMRRPETFVEEIPTKTDKGRSGHLMHHNLSKGTGMANLIFFPRSQVPSDD